MLSGNNAKPRTERACWLDYALLGMNAIDRLLSGLDHSLRTLAGAVYAARPNPADTMHTTDAGPDLEPGQRRLAGALMRVNHVGEVCAQALYQAQALSARSEGVRQQMLSAAREEADHLAWTQQRLFELGDRASWLNPLWYAGAFGIGLVAGRLSDQASLAFVVETERQVEQHLASHMQRLPANDVRSRAIVAQMQADERRHADTALEAGAEEMPRPLRWAMRGVAKLMTVTAHRI
jgi:3-demethoxyubiquinol 3-hydroxylase